LLFELVHALAVSHVLLPLPGVDVTVLVGHGAFAGLLEVLILTLVDVAYVPAAAAVVVLLALSPVSLVDVHALGYLQEDTFPMRDLGTFLDLANVDIAGRSNDLDLFNRSYLEGTV